MRPSVAVALSVAASAPGLRPLLAAARASRARPSPADGEAFEVALFQSTGAHLERGHRWRLENDGRVFTALVEDIGRARASVDIVSYIWHSGKPSDRIVAAL